MKLSCIGRSRNQIEIAATRLYYNNAITKSFRRKKEKRKNENQRRQIDRNQERKKERKKRCFVIFQNSHFRVLEQAFQ